MMNRHWLMLIGALLLASASACSTKQDPIDDLKDLASELVENGNEYSEEQWEEAAQKLKEIETEIQKNDYTDEELKEIGRQKAKCARAWMKNASDRLEEKMHSMKMQIEGAVEEMTSEDE